jgi:PKD repeat protein
MNKLTFLILFSLFVVSTNASSQIHRIEHPYTTNEKLLHPPPVPYFFITGLCFGDTTHFINKTLSTLISSEWNILNDKGDTLYHSENKDLSYYFKKKGFYTICLTANNGHIATKTRVISVDTITKAGFSFRSCYDEFDNQSACSDQFVWVLPDKSLSTSIDPAYAFSAPGNYPVTLVSRKGTRSDTLMKQITIKGDSIGMPVATFTCKRMSADSTFAFRATDASADAYSWYFGDGVGDDTSGYQVIHKIKSSYMPPVNLFITNGCGVAVDLLDPFDLTGIAEEKEVAFTVSIFPNPVRDELLISIGKLQPGKNTSVRLMDANGCVLKQTTFPNAGGNIDFKYEVLGLSSGMYLIQVDTGEEVAVRKFIVN